MDSFDPKNTKARDFRVCYANAVGIQFSGNDMILKFGVMHNVGDEGAGLEEQVAVGMSPSTAKALMYSLQQILAHYETTNKVTIPMSRAVEDAIAKALAAPRKIIK